ncbi:MAG: hypothetical protein V4722_07245 [Bacteroidota bacterium]
MQIVKLFLLVLLFCCACTNKSETTKQDIPFERTKWDMKDDKNYSYRKEMINDLLNNYKWPGLKKDSVVKLLGMPNEIEEDIFMLYHYEQKYIGGMVLSTQSFVVQLAADSSVVLARTN